MSFQPAVINGGRCSPECMEPVDHFSAHMRYRNLSPATIRRRHATLKLFGRFLAPKDLIIADQDDIEGFLASRSAARTRHAYRSDLRAFYGWLVDKGLLDSSPAAKVATIRVPKSLPRPLAVTEILGALTFGSRPVRRMIALALFAGLRCHEIAALLAEDVWLHGDPPMVVVRHGKGAKDRAIPMHPELVALLRDIAPSGPVFPGRNRPTMRPYSVSCAIARHLERAGIEGTPHQIRHSFGTELARQSGGDLLLTATLMGHESTATTMGYVRLTPGLAGKVVAGMFAA